MLAKLNMRLDRLVEYAVALIFLGIVIVGGLQVFYRFFLNASLSWSEEVQKFGHIWIVFLAIPIAYRRGAHIYMDVIRNRYPPALGRLFDLFVELLWLGFALALILLTWRIARVAAFQTSPGLELPMSIPYYGIMIGGGYMVIVALRRIYGWWAVHNVGGRS